MTLPSLPSLLMLLPWHWVPVVLSPLSRLDQREMSSKDNPRPHRRKSIILRSIMLLLLYATNISAAIKQAHHHVKRFVGRLLPPTVFPTLFRKVVDVAELLLSTWELSSTRKKTAAYEICSSWRIDDIFICLIEGTVFKWYLSNGWWWWQQLQ